MSLTTYHYLAVLCFLLSLALGMVFSIMESAILMLNRVRLLQLFGDEHPNGVSEQHIFRETKEVYLVSRLGLCATLILCGFSLAWLLIQFFRTFAAVPASTWPIATGVALAFFLVPPVYLFCAYAVPRLLVRQEQVDSEAELPAWVRASLSAGRFFGFFFRVFSVAPMGRFSFHHQLTKNDLVALVTELETDEPEVDRDGNVQPTQAPAEEEADEEEFIYNMLDMEQTMVREVMKPINKIVALPLGTTTLDDVLYLARSSGFSRFPVYRDRIVDLIGYINVYDILQEEEPSRSLEDYVTPVYVVPEYMRVNTLLKEFLERHIEVAVVVDEYGGCSGWVTRENVLEEIVGEIADEFDHRRRQIRKVKDETDVWLTDGSVHIDDLAEEVPIRFDEEAEFDTVAGFILMTLERMPIVGDQVETEQAVFTVARMEGNRIAEVRIALRSPDEATEE